MRNKKKITPNLANLIYHTFLFRQNRIEICKDDLDQQDRSCGKLLTTDSSGRFIVGEDSVPMQLWQHVDPDGKLHYSLVPVLDDKKMLELSKEITEENPSVSLTCVKMETDEEENNVKTYVGSLVHLYNFYTCDKCNMNFPMESMLNRHKMSNKLNSWLRRKRLNSRHRSKVSSGKQIKPVQSQKSRKRKRYGCTSCEFICNERSALNVHIRKKHKSIVKKDLKILCIICNRKCGTRSNLKKHLEEHRDRKTTYFTCNSCNFLCKRSGTLISHITLNHQTLNSEEISKKRYNDKPSEKEESRGTCLKEHDKDSSTVSSVPFEFECKNEPSVATRASKKQSKKSVEEQCNLCDFKCAKKSTLYSHKRQHKMDIGEEYSCNECSFKTYKKSSLYSHIKRKHKVPKSCTSDGQPQLFYCTQCDYKNKNKYELKVHVARKHTDDFKFSCETCGKKFKVKGDLTNHIRFSHKEQPVICDVCGKTCLNSNSLYVHQKFAHYKAKYECQVCKRRMVTQENLNEHMIRQHEKRENVVCEECGKTFSRNSRLKVHMRIHTGDKPYTCTICNKSFARRTALKQHLLIHTGIRPYVCDICGKAFTQKPGLISHRKSHPGSHPPLPRVLIDHILNDVMNN